MVAGGRRAEAAAWTDDDHPELAGHVTFSWTDLDWPVRFYLPATDVRTDLLTASETITYCPYKGWARYLSHPEVADVAWSYPDPIPENPKIRDLICFFNERVDLVVDGSPAGRPQTPWS